MQCIYNLGASLTIESFLEMFWRLLAGRGCPFIIYINNGTNFGGVYKMFTDLELAKIRNNVLIKSMIWKFILPVSACLGDWW